MLDIIDDEERGRPENERDRLIAHGSSTKLNNSIQEFMAMSAFLLRHCLRLVVLLLTTVLEQGATSAN